ncbi:MAG: flagellin [Verrucomicrobiota bacterium]|jgi:flagellin
MVINTNIAALNSANDLDQSTSALNESLARLSSGSKIVNASDDPAGLSESMELTEQIGETNAANSIVSNALSFSQTQDGYLQQVSAALNQMATLATEAQDPTKSSTDLANYTAEFNALGSYINSVASQKFNTVSLFNGANLTVPTGGTSTYSMTGINLASDMGGVIATADLTSTDGQTAALGAVNTAITTLAGDRGTVGANEETLTYTGNELGVLSTNLAAANSNLTDVDVAQESTNYAKEQILVQSGTAMLAQANANPQSILKLLQ